MELGPALSRSWARFQQNPVPLVLGTLVVLVVLLVAHAPAIVIAYLMPGFFGGLIASFLNTCIAMLVMGPISGGYFVLVGKASTGVTPEVGDVFYPLRSGRLVDFIMVGAVLQVANLLALVPLIGGFLALAVGVVVTFIFSFSIVLVAKGADWKTSLGRSKDLVAANWVTTLLLVLTTVALLIGGALCLLVGLLVAMPVTSLLYVDVFLGLDSAGPQAVQPHSHAPQEARSDQYGYPGA